jgi:hypothetical protein
MGGAAAAHLLVLAAAAEGTIVGQAWDHRWVPHVHVRHDHLHVRLGTARSPRRLWMRDEDDPRGLVSARNLTTGRLNSGTNRAGEALDKRHDAARRRRQELVSQRVSIGRSGNHRITRRSLPPVRHAGEQLGACRSHVKSVTG